jgi:hypothetical protein
MKKQSHDKLKIPTHTLPEGWRELGAAELGVSPSMIEKVVYGLKENKEVFKYMLQLAEQEKIRRDAEDNELKLRLIALS